MSEQPALSMAVPPAANTEAAAPGANGHGAGGADLPQTPCAGTRTPRLCIPDHLPASRATLLLQIPGLFGRVGDHSGSMPAPLRSSDSTGGGAGSRVSPATPSSRMSVASSVRETNRVSLEYDPILKRKVLNTYEILSEIGHGEHGKVKLARDLIRDELVAIKIVNRHGKRSGRLLRRPSGRASAHGEAKIRREIAIMKRCDHRYIVRLLEVLDDVRLYKIYLVLEYMDRGEIKWKRREPQRHPLPADARMLTDSIPCCLANDNDLLLNEYLPNLSFRQSRKIFRDVVLGLEYLHMQGIVHRDIKPANLLVAQDFTVKISDFGVSFALSLDEPGYSDKELAKTVGTPAFYAPELCETSLLAPSSSTNVVQASHHTDESLVMKPSESQNTLRPETSPQLERTNTFSEPDGPGPDPAAAAAPASASASASANLPLLLASSAPARLPVNYKIDIWALGVTLYCLLFGRVPFNADSEFALFHVIVNQDVEFPELKELFFPPQQISDHEFELGKDLLRHLLDKNPSSRYSIAQIKEHPFVLMDIEDDVEKLHEFFFLNQEFYDAEVPPSAADMDAAVVGVGARLKASMMRAIKHADTEQIRRLSLKMEQLASAASSSDDSPNLSLMGLSSHLYPDRLMILSEDGGEHDLRNYIVRDKLGVDRLVDPGHRAPYDISRDRLVILLEIARDLPTALETALNNGFFGTAAHGSSPGSPALRAKPLSHQPQVSLQLAGLPYLHGLDSAFMLRPTSAAVSSSSVAPHSDVATPHRLGSLASPALNSSPSATPHPILHSKGTTSSSLALASPAHGQGTASSPAFLASAAASVASAAPPVVSGYPATPGSTASSYHHASSTIPHGNTTPAGISTPTTPAGHNGSMASVAASAAMRSFMLLDVLDRPLAGSSRKGSTSEAPQIETKRNVGGDLYLRNQLALDAFKDIQQADQKTRRSTRTSLNSAASRVDLDSEHAGVGNALGVSRVSTISTSSAAAPSSPKTSAGAAAANLAGGRITVGPISIDGTNRRRSLVISLPLTESFASLDSFNDEYLTYKYQELRNQKAAQPALEERLFNFNLGSLMGQDPRSSRSTAAAANENIPPHRAGHNLTSSTSAEDSSSESASSDEDDLTFKFTSKVAPKRPAFLLLANRALSHDSNLPDLIHHNNTADVYDMPIVFQDHFLELEDVPAGLMAPAPSKEESTLEGSAAGSGSITPSMLPAPVLLADLNPSADAVSALKFAVATGASSSNPSNPVTKPKEGLPLRREVPTVARKNLVDRRAARAPTSPAAGGYFNNHYRKEHKKAPFPLSKHLDADRESDSKRTLRLAELERPAYLRSNSITVGLLQRDAHKETRKDE